MDLTMTFAVLSGIGMVAFSVGAFGVLDAYHKRHPHLSRVDWLISLYMFGVLLNVVAYLVYTPKGALLRPVRLFAQLPGVVSVLGPDGEQRRADQRSHCVKFTMLPRATEPSETDARAS